jgi:hypothetical protein
MRCWTVRTHRRELGFVGASEMRSFEIANRQKRTRFSTSRLNLSTCRVPELGYGA